MLTGLYVGEEADLACFLQTGDNLVEHFVQPLGGDGYGVVPGELEEEGQAYVAAWMVE